MTQLVTMVSMGFGFLVGNGIVSIFGEANWVAAYWMMLGSVCYAITDFIAERRVECHTKRPVKTC